MTLNAQDLRVEKGGVTLFSELNLCCHQGQVLAIMGASGSGKTTLLRVLCGLESPLEGTVTLDGKAPPNGLGWPSYRRQVVYVQQRGVMRQGTVWENLKLPFEFKSATTTFEPEAAMGLLDRLGLRGKRDENTRRLSQGEVQRVALVRALLVQPRFLLLDEPTSALDAVNGERVEALLGERVAAGELGLLLVTHDPRQADRLAHERLTLRESGS